MGLALIVLGLPGGLIWLADWDITEAAPSLRKRRLTAAD
jgi:hypothetical protein